jgi:hypothetical protein
MLIFVSRFIGGSNVIAVKASLARFIGWTEGPTCEKDVFLQLNSIVTIHVFMF